MQSKIDLDCTTHEWDRRGFLFPTEAAGGERGTVSHTTRKI